jgi:hypothetical protein
MKSRTSLILFVLGLVVFAAGLITASRHRLSPLVESRSEAALAFPALADKLGQVSRIEIITHDKRLLLSREGETWRLPDHGGYPAIPSRVHGLLTGLVELRLTEKRTSDPADFARLGLDAPQNAGSEAKEIRLTDAKGDTLADLIVGHVRPSPEAGQPDQLFVRLGGVNQTWLASGTLEADPDPGLWMDRDIVNISRDKITGITVDRVAPPAGRLVLTRKNDKLEVTDPAAHPVLDQFKIDTLNRALEFLSFTDAKSAAAQPGTRLGRVTFTTSDGLSLAADVSAQGNDVWAVLSFAGEGKAKDEADRLNRKLGGYALAIPGWQPAGIVPSLDDLKPPPAPAGPPVSHAPDAPPPSSPSPAGSAAEAPAGSANPSH